MIPVLRGPRLTLRGFTWADFAPFAAMWQTPEVAQYIPFAPVEPDDSWARFNGNIYNWVKQGYGGWAAVDGAGVFQGTLTFFSRVGGYGDDYDTAIQAGWVFGPQAHGQGFASEAAALAHTWLDAQPFGGRSVCGMDPAHAASIRVAEKAGYRLLRMGEDAWGSVQLMQRLRPA